MSRNSRNILVLGSGGIATSGSADEVTGATRGGRLAHYKGSNVYTYASSGGTLTIAADSALPGAPGIAFRCGFKATMPTPTFCAPRSRRFCRAIDS